MGDLLLRRNQSTEAGRDGWVTKTVNTRESGANQLFARSACKDQLCLDDLIADSVSNEFTDRMQLQLAHDVCTMCLGGFHANVER